MKKILPWFFVLAGAGTAVSALAEPDWKLIEQARKANSPEAQAKVPECAQRKVVLPLDHGPRAQTTPWMNQQRLKKLAEQGRCPPQK